MMDFKESPFMYAIALGVIAFVIAQSVFFLVKSLKRGKELGISSETLKTTMVSSAVFTVAPAISILATVLVLANALGIVLPWIRLSVIGNLAYETTAAQTALDFWGTSLNKSVSDPQQFATISWAMTLGSIAPLLLLPFLCKKLQKKVGSAVNKSEKSKKFGDAISAAAFIGIVMAFVSREIYSYTVQKSNVADANGNSIVNEAGEILKVRTISGSAGVMSILVLVCAVVFMLILEVICKKFKLTKLEPFTMPIAMFAAMGMAVLFTNVLPEEIVSRTWFEIGSELGQLYE
ncbi:MAG: DUF5058 family protein [Clostridia bacterium]|nr:DUF5058 family protein [Clostridia bacterium]